MAAAGTYNVTITDANGCTGSTSTTVVINTLPNPTALKSVLCKGETISLNANGLSPFQWTYPDATTSATANYTNPIWKEGSATGTIVTSPTTTSPSVTTTYFLTADSSNACKGSIYIVVTVNSLPDFTLSKPVACPGSSEEVNITGLINAVPATAQLKIDAGSYSTYPNPATLTGLSVGSHTVAIKNAEGCATAKNITINAIKQNICLPVSVTRSH